MAQQFSQSMNQFLPSACVVDLTPPTFAGISGTTPNTDGSITAAWSAATDVTGPIEYGIYIALGVVSAAALFVSTNLVTISPFGTTSKRIFTLADQSTYLINGVQYTMGVRSKDGVGNIDTNLVIATPTAIASGNLPGVFQTLATNIAATEVLLAADEVAIAATEVLLAADHVNFAADHVNFVADDAAFDADHANFVADHANFVADDVAFDADIAALDATLAAAQSVLDSISGGGGTSLTASLQTETVLDVELIESV